MTTYVEKDESRVEYAKRKAALDVRVEMNGATMAMKGDGDEKSYSKVTEGLYLWADRDCPDQTLHNNREIPEGQRPGFSCRFPSLKLYVC